MYEPQTEKLKMTYSLQLITTRNHLHNQRYGKCLKLYLKKHGFEAKGYIRFSIKVSSSYAEKRNIM